MPGGRNLGDALTNKLANLSWHLGVVLSYLSREDDDSVLFARNQSIKDVRSNVYS